METACILVGQEELDMERFALAPALPQAAKEGEEEEANAEPKEKVELDSASELKDDIGSGSDETL
jgi:hypothetical protein